MRSTPGLVLRSAAALALVVVAVLCVRHGVLVRPSTGGLLVAPVPTTRVLGAWIALAVVAATAAVLVAVSAGHGWWRRRDGGTGSAPRHPRGRPGRMTP